MSAAPWIFLGVVAALGCFVLYTRAYDAGYADGHDAGFAQARGQTLPPPEQKQ